MLRSAAIYDYCTGITKNIIERGELIAKKGNQRFYRLNNSVATFCLRPEQSTPEVGDVKRLIIKNNTGSTKGCDTFDFRTYLHTTNRRTDTNYGVSCDRTVRNIDTGATIGQLNYHIGKNGQVEYAAAYTPIRGLSSAHTSDSTFGHWSPAIESSWAHSFGDFVKEFNSDIKSMNPRANL